MERAGETGEVTMHRPLLLIAVGVGIVASYMLANATKKPE